MSWYDYIPVVGSATRAAKDAYHGDWADAGGNLLDLGTTGGLGWDAVQGGKAIHGANQQQQQGYYAAANAMKQSGQRARDFEMQGLDKAEGYYAPAQARIRAAYGDPGSVTR